MLSKDLTAVSLDRVARSRVSRGDGRSRWDRVEIHQVVRHHNVKAIAGATMWTGVTRRAIVWPPQPTGRRTGIRDCGGLDLGHRDLGLSADKRIYGKPFYSGSVSSGVVVRLFREGRGSRGAADEDLMSRSRNWGAGPETSAELDLPVVIAHCRDKTDNLLGELSATLTAS